MGILDNATNNIIIDAVLTDLGRIALARNDGSFSISRYSFGDDEVDYGLITRFGRTVGKEKIIKNTPVFEAITDSSLALKHQLVTLRIPNLDRVPIITLEGSAVTAATTSSPVTVLTVTKNKTERLTLSQTIINENTVPQQLVDGNIKVQADNRFLVINNSRPAFIDTNNVATYNIVRGKATRASSKGGAVYDLNIRAKSIADSMFTTFGNVSDKTKITTFIKITGTASGALTYIEVVISQT